MSTLLSESIERINEAVISRDPLGASAALQKLEVAGFREDAEHMRKVLGPRLTSPRSKGRMSRAERKASKRLQLLYTDPKAGALIVHPVNGGSPRSFERLPSVEMLVGKKRTGNPYMLGFDDQDMFPEEICSD